MANNVYSSSKKQVLLLSLAVFLVVLDSQVRTVETLPVNTIEPQRTNLLFDLYSSYDIKRNDFADKKTTFISNLTREFAAKRSQVGLVVYAGNHGNHVEEKVKLNPLNDSLAGRLNPIKEKIKMIIEKVKTFRILLKNTGAREPAIIPVIQLVVDESNGTNANLFSQVVKVHIPKLINKSTYLSPEGFKLGVLGCAGSNVNEYVIRSVQNVQYINRLISSKLTQNEKENMVMGLRRAQEAIDYHETSTNRSYFNVIVAYIGPKVDPINTEFIDNLVTLVKSGIRVKLVDISDTPFMNLNLNKNPLSNADLIQIDVFKADDTNELYASIEKDYELYINSNQPIS